MAYPHKCIFCLKESDEFNTIEHIVPESLGNTEDILPNAVCDKCQNYFGKEIESFVLSKTSFAFWKTIAGTKNKKGKTPFYDPSQSKSKHGAIDNYHPYTDNGVVMHPGDNESIVAVDIFDEDMANKILTGKKNEFHVVFTPKMLIYIGRFLGKIAMEYLCKEFGDKVFITDFDELRNYTRYGTTNSIWPIQLGRLSENLLIYKPYDGLNEIRALYAYSFFEDSKSGLLLFNFDIGSDRYSIVLNCKFPNGKTMTRFLPALCEGTNGLPHVLYYDI